MYSKFILNDLKASHFKNNTLDGKLYYKAMSNDVRGELEKFIGIDGTIDGTKLQEEWFPTSKWTFNIFLSHSHADEQLAVSLAGYLQKEFGLNVFIDSCLWGYANELLRKIDEKYCLSSDGRHFNYNKRNYSTSHIHMMLANALLRMIDNCEAVFFLNTENSISICEEIKKRTASPWIYTELSMANRISIRPVEYYRKKLSEDEGVTESVSLKIDYHIERELKKFIPLSIHDIQRLKAEWTKSKREYEKRKPEWALDWIYSQKQINPNENIHRG